MAAVFYARLPAEVAYHFQGSVPDRFMSRGAFIGWIIVPQIFFTMVGWSIIRMILFWAKYVPPGETPLKELLPVMGNITAVPQIVFFTALLQLSIYNAFKTGIIPLWISATVILVVGAAVIIAVFMRVSRKYRRKKAKHVQEL